MSTVNDLMLRSMEMLVVAGDEADIEAVESENYITVLNGLADEYESLDGVDLSWTAVTNVANTLTSPAGIFLALAAVMAERIAPEYGVAMTPNLVNQAAQGHRHILRICTTRTGAYKPATLPLGSGNEGDSGTYDNDRFYSGAD